MLLSLDLLDRSELVVSCVPLAKRQYYGRQRSAFGVD